MDLPEGVVLLDSLGDLQPLNTSPILVCGSHCGGNQSLALHIKDCHVKAVFLNNAGVGKNQAGIRGIRYYEAEGIVACAVDHHSAEIGVSHDIWESGTISHTCSQAEAAGIQKGDTVKVAVEKIKDVLKLQSLNQTSKNFKFSNENIVTDSNKENFKKQVHAQLDGVCLTIADSITFLNEKNSGDIVVCGSHGGVSAGEYAIKHQVKAVFFNDAGIGKNNAGIKSLESLNDAGIIACTVDCMSAEIFNGQDALKNGIITVCNQMARTRNIKENMTVKESIKLI